MNNIDIPASPWDIFLFPIWVHRKISVRLRSLLPAFLFVGCFDMFFYRNLVNAGLFNGDILKFAGTFIVFLLLSLMIGVVDVVCTMLPIAEFAVIMGRRSEKYVSGRMPVILMKSYAISHILFIVPTAIYVYSGIEWASIDMSSSSQARLLFSFILVIMSFLAFVQLGVIYRTVSVRTRLQLFDKLIMILVAYFWMQISGGAVVYLEGLFSKILERLF